MFRTTITVDETFFEAIGRYRTGYGTAFGRKPSFSEVVANALQVALPLILNRIPQEGEDLETALIRQARMLKEILHLPSISEPMVRTVMVEANRLARECERLFLRDDGKPNPHAYRRCTREAAEVTNLALNLCVLREG